MIKPSTAADTYDHQKWGDISFGTTHKRWGYMFLNARIVLLFVCQRCASLPKILTSPKKIPRIWQLSPIDNLLLSINTKKNNNLAQ